MTQSPSVTAADGYPNLNRENPREGILITREVARDEWDLGSSSYMVECSSSSCLLLTPNGSSWEKAPTSDGQDKRLEDHFILYYKHEFISKQLRL